MSSLVKYDLLIVDAREKQPGFEQVSVFHIIIQARIIFQSGAAWTID